MDVQTGLQGQEARGWVGMVFATHRIAGSTSASCRRRTLAGMSNRLAHESSPYLRQHADNPVDWWPWGEAALAAAREQNKPILLSIGYAACHWCHVMAHESFEDAATAQVMNARYINIKVDREERPDLDKVYQLAHQALTRRGGGWPLTMFLDPHDLLPFYAGTYFPPSPRYNMPAFVQVLEGVRAWFDDKPDEVRSQNASLAAFLAQHGRDTAHSDTLDDAPIRNGFERIAAAFDAVNGGHSGAPKFPHASEIELLLAVAANAQSTFADDAEVRSRAQSMAELSLLRMAQRGLADHLGGGFFRYCVDAEWSIPHFEKMLYDNAQLLPLYAWTSRRQEAEANETTGDASRTAAVFHDTVISCAGWLARDLQAPGGGFWSSWDADSEGEEGRYYVWQADAVRNALNESEWTIAAAYYGLDQAPNFEGEAWHLLVARPLAEVAAEHGIDPGEAQKRLTQIQNKLLAQRELRTRPALDDKILTAWNALAIAGAARAARWMREAPLLAEAESALDFLYANAWRDGRLYASHARGVTRFAAYLDDHAFLLDALLAMLQVRWSRRDLDGAIALADALIEHFEDAEHGGFFFTAHDAETLPQRPKPWMDESLPSGNGIAARALLKLGHLLGEIRYLDAAERTLRAAWPTLVELPHACCTLLLALDEFLHPPTHVVLRINDDELPHWRDALAQVEPSHGAIYRIPALDDPLPGTLDAQTHRAGGVAYICQGTQCLPPTTDPAVLANRA